MTLRFSFTTLLRACTFATIVVWAVLVPNAASAFWTRTIDLCVADFLRAPVSIPELAVGCQAPGCCTACESRSELYWNVEMSADPALSMNVQFSGLGSARLSTDGEASLLAGNLLRLGSGRSQISGFERTLEGRAAVASLSLVSTSPDFAKRLDALAEGVPFGTELSRVEVVITQLLEPSGQASSIDDVEPAIVAQSGAVVRVLNCPTQQPRTDRLDLAGNDSRDEAVILLSGARNGDCTKRELWRGRDIIYLGNMLPASDCDHSAWVFSDGDAVRFSRFPAGDVLAGSHLDVAGSAVESPNLAPDPLPEWVDDAALELATLSPHRNVAAEGWTAAEGDLLSFDLPGGRRSLGVAVWSATLTAGNEERLLQRSRTQLALTDRLLDRSHCGLELYSTAVLLPALPMVHARTVIDAVLSRSVGASCEAIAQTLEAADLWSGRVINLYFVDEELEAFACPRQQLVVIGINSQPEVLLNRLARSLSLGDVGGSAGGIDFDGNGDADFGSDNLMALAAERRESLSEGQCARVNFDPRSSLNLLGRPIGRVRTCSPTDEGPDCLPLGFDARPN
jgi:hypothetical protein